MRNTITGSAAKDDAKKKKYKVEAAQAYVQHPKPFKAAWPPRPNLFRRLAASLVDYQMGRRSRRSSRRCRTWR